MNMASPASKRNLAAGHPPAFPPNIVVAVKALACECRTAAVCRCRAGRSPNSAEVVAKGIVAQVSGSTLWRWFGREALCPWRYRSWIFPRDPNFAAKAGRVLDLYQGCWRGAPLGRRDFVLRPTRKPASRPARRSIVVPASTGIVATCIEHEYCVPAHCAYLAAWDVHRARLFGRCERKNSVAAFHRLVGQVMGQEPYRSARRVFLIADNGSCHRGQRAADRLRTRWPNVVLVHTPVHASWLNQIEIYFSVVQRKLLTPSDFKGLADLNGR